MDTNIVLFESADHEIQLQVGLSGKTVWLTQEQMSELFDRSVSVISRHIKNAVEEGEINPESNLHKMQNMRSGGGSTLYDLDVVISVGYRVKSQRGVEFRRWATDVLRRYIIDGHAENEKRRPRKQCAFFCTSPAQDEHLKSSLREVRSKTMQNYRCDTSKTMQN